MKKLNVWIFPASLVNRQLETIILEAETEVLHAGIRARASSRDSAAAESDWAQTLDAWPAWFVTQGRDLHGHSLLPRTVRPGPERPWERAGNKTRPKNKKSHDNQNHGQRRGDTGGRMWTWDWGEERKLDIGCTSLCHSTAAHIKCVIRDTEVPMQKTHLIHMWFTVWIQITLFSC